MWSKVSGGFGLFANGGSGPSAPSTVLDAATGAWSQNFVTYTTDRPQKQYRVDGSKFFDIGTMNHELKFGFGYRDTPVAFELDLARPGRRILGAQLRGTALTARRPACRRTARSPRVTRDADKNVRREVPRPLRRRHDPDGQSDPAGRPAHGQAGVAQYSPPRAAASAIIGTPLTLPCSPGSGLPCTAPATSPAAWRS